jgi:SAM-dependent methyltransferase
VSYRDEFDTIGAFDVIEHIEDDVGAMREIYRALKPGGGFMIIVPQHMFLWSRVDDLAFHKRRYARRELTAKLEKPASSSNASCRSSLF